MESENIPVTATGREYRKKRVEELGSALAQIRARVKASRGSGLKKDEEVEQSGSSKPPEDTERTALTKKILEEDRDRFKKLQQNRVRMKEEYNQILIEREEQKKVEKQLQETIAKVTAPTPELPPLIKQRIIDLETNVENLKERLSEKDKVLSSKTQALTVLHNQLMQRSQEQVEKAMAFTQEISTIKEDFGKREELLKKEITRLKEREEELELRLSDKETHWSEIDSLQVELHEVKRQLDETLQKNEESTKTLETTNKINVKLKAQLKALKIERDKLKQVQESIEDTDVLKNRIALLEEEKESQENLEGKVSELKGELSKLRENLKSLEGEKVSLQNSLDSASNQIKEQDIEMENLKSSLKELEEQKISAEMRSIEVEEKMESFQSSMFSEIEKFKSEIYLLQSQIDEKNSIIESLSNQLSLKEQEIFDIKGNNFPGEIETDSRLREIESYNSELVEKVRELMLNSEGHEKAVIKLNESLAEKNETINSLRIKCEDLKAIVTDLNNNKTLLENEIQALKANEDIRKREPQTRDSTEPKDDPNLKFKKLAANYKIKVKLCQDFEEKLKASNFVIEEKTSEIFQLKSQLNELISEVEGLRNQEQQLNKDLESVSSKNQQLLRLVEELTPRLEAMEAEKSTALHKADQVIKAFEELREWKEGDSKLLKEHATSVNTMASNVSLLEQELGNLQSILNDKNYVIGELEIERKKLVDDMRNSEFELDRLRSLYQQESVKNQNVLTNLQGLESEMLVSREEMNQIAEQLELVTKNYNACLGNLQERENYIEALEQDIVGMKTKMYNLESGIGERHRRLEERGNQLSARLEEAEILTQTFDKYQAEMDAKFNVMEENEKSFKSELLKLQDEIKNLNEVNQELQEKNISSEKQISEMSEEIDTLKDVKNSYNTTLDRIEILNEDLKQVMCDFESKNLELIRLGEERTDLFNKLTDLEDAYSDLKGQLDESEEQTIKLQSELVMKTNALENSLLEIKSLKNQLEEVASENTTVKEPSVVASEVQVFSWDQHSQVPTQSSIIPTGNNVELEETRKKLLDAQQEIYHLQLQITTILSQKDSEISLLKEELSKLLDEFNNLKNRPSSLSNNSEQSAISLFSWDQSQTNVESGSSLPDELIETKKKLEIAEQEINNIKLTILSQKDSEISLLKEELSKLLDEFNNLKNRPSSLSDNTEQHAISLFSWDQSQTNVNDASSLPDDLMETKKKLEIAEQEISHLKSTIHSIINGHETELAQLKGHSFKELNEQDYLQKLGAPQVNQGSANEIHMFTWSEPDKDETLGVTAHKEAVPLQKANIEIDNLKKLVNEKDLEISTLKEKISDLFKQKEDVEQLLNAKKPGFDDNKAGDTNFFSWDQHNQEMGRDEEEGWGWIGAEAHLEQDHKHSEALQILNLTQKLKDLEEERNTLNEKLNSSKIKCVKLIKKLKEIEALQEQSKSERNVGFSDLDFALQEEMRSQLDQLEAKNKELVTELNTLKLERENLNKKVDVLISANDELIEMKERQDIEVQMWQKRSAELKNEIQGLHWSLEELKSENPSLSKEDGELSDKLNALAAENEKLQSIICNLKDGRPLGSPDIVAELNTLKDEIKKLKDIRLKEKESFENELRKANEELDSMEQQFDILSKENQSLKDRRIEVANYNQEIIRLNEQVQFLTESNNHYQELANKNNNLWEMENRLELLSNENSVLRNQSSNLGTELNSLKQQSEQLLKENESLKVLAKSNENVKGEMTSLLGKIESLGIENANLKLSLAQNSQPSLEQIHQVDSLQQKYDYVTAELNILKGEFQKLSVANKNLEEEVVKTKESSYLEVRKFSENLELAESKIKNLHNDLQTALNELSELDSKLKDIIVKYNISVSSGKRIELLNQLVFFTDNLHDLNSQLTNEVGILKEQLTGNQSEAAPIQLGLTPPVFKGFSAFPNDPFDNPHSNSQSSEFEKLKTESVQLKSIINTYELELSRLNSERVTNEQIITDLKNEISAMNEHVAKLNLQRSNLSDDVRLKLERADIEISRWRDEAANLRREMNNLIEKHSQEIDELRRNNVGSKEKLSEIEENFQNTMLNKDQESGYLKQILSEKEQLLANALNERNALQVQFESISQQTFSLENRIRSLTQENEELQGALNQSRREENTVIEKQKEEIQELMAKLEYLSQSQNLRGPESENEKLLKKQVKDLSENVLFLEQSNTDLQSKLTLQSEEISKLHAKFADLESKRIYLESTINEKQKEIDSLRNEKSLAQESHVVEDGSVEKLSAMIKQKDLEIARVSKVLLDTQERLVQVQESKPIDKVMSLQSKLDQALYTVHVRDVKCDELTQEIMQLLEERDSLQLRLSEALRENEILRKGTADSSATSPELKEKLGELRKGYKKDPAIKLDMESRHNQQMDLYSDKENEALNPSADFGIFNWFFSTSSPPPQQQS